MNKSNKLNSKQEFEKLFNSFYPALCTFASNIVINESVAEDFVQEIFIKLWEKFDNFNDINAIKSFLYTSVKNKCINHLDHEKVIQKHEEHKRIESKNQESFSNHIIEEETHRMIYEAINELPVNCKKILMHSINGLKNAEVAEELNISINTVKTQKKIAYKQLKIKLKDVYILAGILLSIY